MAQKNAAAVSLGRRGGLARKANMTNQQRSDAARKAVQARWAKTKQGLAELERAAAARWAKQKKADKK